MSDTPLDLCAAQKLAEAVSPGYGDYSRLAQETLALLAHCRALRAALRDTASVGTAYEAQWREAYMAGWKDGYRNVPVGAGDGPQERPAGPHPFGHVMGKPLQDGYGTCAHCGARENTNEAAAQCPVGAGDRPPAPSEAIAPDVEDYINAVRQAFGKRWPYETNAQLWDALRAAILDVLRAVRPTPAMIDAAYDVLRGALNHQGDYARVEAALRAALTAQERA